MKYSIVIPTYNHCDDLLKPCIESIMQYTNVSDIELIISANGCKDNTFEYLGSLKEKYKYLGLGNNIKIAWSDEPLGYAGATNAGIKLATTDLIVLLNNDVLLIGQPRNHWLTLLATPFNNPTTGITCVVKGISPPAGHEFAVFFCVMIHRKVFDKIGLLSMEYGIGAGEDTEFCIEAVRAGFEIHEAMSSSWSSEANTNTGNFPIYHKGEGTVHDTSLVPDWDSTFLRNSLTLAKKYNPAWYKWRISNDGERGVFFKNDLVFPREQSRYIFAASNLIGKKVLDVGCSSGYGAQFFPVDVEYVGIDNDSEIIVAANAQQWGANTTFIHSDINEFLSTPNRWDTIIAFEVLNHIENGLEVFDKLKQHCDRLFISVPYNTGHFNKHHRLHNLTLEHFNGCFELGLLDINGNVIKDKSSLDPNAQYHLMLYWDIHFTNTTG